LEDYIYLGDEDEESPFRAALVEDSDELRGIGHADISDDYILNYNSCLGYRAKKKGKDK
jgi:hypothetical protein